MVIRYSGRAWKRDFQRDIRYTGSDPFAWRKGPGDKNGENKEINIRNRTEGFSVRSAILPAQRTREVEKFKDRLFQQKALDGKNRAASRRVSTVARLPRSHPESGTSGGAGSSATQVRVTSLTPEAGNHNLRRLGTRKPYGPQSTSISPVSD